MNDLIDIGAVPTRTELIGRWPIDIGVAPTQTKLIGRWPIDIGAAPTQTDTIMIDRYRCGPTRKLS